MSLKTFLEKTWIYWKLYFLFVFFSTMQQVLRPQLSKLFLRGIQNVRPIANTNVFKVFNRFLFSPSLLHIERNHLSIKRCLREHDLQSYSRSSSSSKYGIFHSALWIHSFQLEDFVANEVEPQAQEYNAKEQFNLELLRYSSTCSSWFLENVELLDWLESQSTNSMEALVSMLYLLSYYALSFKHHRLLLWLCMKNYLLRILRSVSLIWVYSQAITELVV